MPAAKTPRLRLLAGPNGSGKSTIKHAIPSQLLGVDLNADDIEQSIRTHGQFDCSRYGTSASDLLYHLQHAPLILAHPHTLASVHRLYPTEHTIHFDAVDSYIASALVEFLRYRLLADGESFTFETVMSHESKVAFLRDAQAQGFRTYLYFVATVDPDINISRVAYRVQTGGHSVPHDKIIKRYHQSLDLLLDAVTYSNRAFIFDNSSDSERYVLLAEVVDGDELDIKVDRVPAWFQRALLDKLE